jgi:hypothetical protein
LVSTKTIMKIWILATLCFLLFWIIRLIPDSLERFYNIVFVSSDYYNRIVVGGWMYSLAAIGNVARFIGVIIGLVSLFLIWKSTKSFLNIRKLVATALSLESFYYATLIPSSIWLFALAEESTISYTLGISYLLQIIFTVPFLAVFAFKLIKHGESPINLQLLKWGGIAFAGYVLALWANTVLRWFDMVSTVGVQIFFTGLRLVGVLNAFIFMFLAVIFAIACAFSLTKQKKSAKKWLGLSLTVIGLHYAIHAVILYSLGMINSIWLIDIWAIPLLGLGLTILLDRTSAKKTT